MKKMLVMAAWTAMSVRAATPVPAELPEAVRSGLVFWVDANTNVIADSSGGNVEMWADTREVLPADGDVSAHTWVYPYANGAVFAAENVNNSVPPTFHTNEARFPGKRFVDFGEYGSGKWLQFRDGSGARKTLTVRSFFCVAGFGTTCGHLLSMNGDDKGGTVFFHKGSADIGVGSISTDTGDSVMYEGETRLNGERIDPRHTSYQYNDYQVFEQNGPGNSAKGAPCANNFLNDRNYNTLNGGTVVRQGGARIGEMLIYDRALAEHERRQVEAYLFAKWFGRTVYGTIGTAADETVEIAGDAWADELSGNGTVVKKGAGTLTVDRAAELFTGTMRVEGGGVAFSQKALWPTFGLVPGMALNMRLRSLEVAADGAVAADESRVTKTSSEEGAPVVAVESFADGLKKLTVDGCELALQGHVTDDAWSAFYGMTNPVANGSFEEDEVTGSNSYRGFQAGDPVRWSGSANRGWAKPGSPWLQLKDATPVAVASGNQALYLQGHEDGTCGWAEQTVTVPQTGLYELKYFFTRRAIMNPVQLGIFVDGMDNPVAKVWSKNKWATVDRTIEESEDFREYGVLVPLAKGNHVIRFAVLPTGTNDRAALIDDVRLVPVASGEYVVPFNAGFDTAKPDIVNNSARNGCWERSPTDSGWTFSSSGTAGITQSPSTWFAGEGTRGLHAAYVQRNGSISGTVTFPHAGRVRLSVRYANRRPEGNRNRPTGHSCRVTLDEDELGSLVPVSNDLREWRSGAFEVAAGARTLTFQGVNLADNGDRSTIIDEPVFWYVDPTRDLMLDGTLKGGDSVTADAAIAQGGVYALNLEIHGAVVDSWSYFNRHDRYPHLFDVLLDGKKVCGIKTDEPESHVFRIRLPYLTAGAHTVELRGEAGNKQAAETVVERAIVTPLAVDTVAGCLKSKETRLELKNGATIRVDTPETVKFAGLRVGGVSRSGVFTAADCDFVTGPGAVCAGSGTLVIVR